jgi:starch-binding outer membrane protein, SusD/RagB family
MKTKIWLYTASLIGLTLFPGCEKPLEEQVFSFIAPENFYRNATDAQVALNAVYDGLQGFHLADRAYMIGDMGSDDTFTGEFRGNQDRIQVDEFTVDANNGILRDRFENTYIALNRANAVIARVPGINMDATLRDNIVNQARFIRAFLYFDLVQLYGAVPLRVEETNSLAEVGSPRVPVARIYDEVILPDLRAAENLPVAQSNRGAATRGAAKALLARVLMTRAGSTPGSPLWAQARDKAREVMDLGVHRLLPNYNDVFLLQNENSAEHLFSAQFSAQQNEGSSFQVFFQPRGINGIVANGNGVNEPTFDIVQAFEPNDQRYNTAFIREFRLQAGGSRWYAPTGDCAGSPTPCTPRPYIGKYFETSLPIGNLNYPYIRYSDVLLMFAEAANEASGPSDAAYDAINQVRRRAGLANLPTGLSQAQFRERVRQERRVELCFEAIRRYDLVRWGTLLPTMREHFRRFYPTLVANVQDHEVLFPIPQREIDLNPAIEQADQNPGY